MRLVAKLSLVILLASGGIGLVAGSIAAAFPTGLVQLAVTISTSAALVAVTVLFVSKRLVSNPIQELAETVSEISASPDDSPRIERTATGDEVGLLVDNLNELFQRGEQRVLQAQQEHEQYVQGEDSRLKDKIFSRTKELHESNLKLQAATTEAQAATTRVTAQNDERNQAIAEMTHELRTPMNGVMGMAELLLNTDLAPLQLEYVRTILESSEDLLSLVNNMLDFAKIEADQLERIDTRPFSPVTCVAKVSQLLVARAEMKGLSLSSECADGVPHAILGDGKRLRQVLINIIGNAIKFTDSGSIVVRVALVEQNGDVSTIRFEVVDTGIGVPDHLHGHIFEQFSQADRSTTRQFGGAGLGLTISKHLVELMGGQIGIVSRPGVGSNFWFTIKGAHRHPANAADRDLSGVHALIVGSGRPDRESLQVQLTGSGATNVEAADVDEALATLQTSQFDLIMIDTAQDGPSLAREIHASEVTQSLPTVLVSNIERPPDELAKYGIDGWVRRPVEERELFACVAGLTGRLDLVIAPEDQEAVSPDGKNDVAGSRILVAEDHSVNRRITMTLVETLKCRGDFAMNGIEAVDAVQREAYDVVLLDCQMPKLDGYEAARQIRSLEQQGKVQTRGSSRSQGHLPIVALTAHTSAADRARCMESGMDDFVSKPFTLRVLRNVLTKWVEGRQLESLELPAAPEGADPGPSPTDDAPICEDLLDEILELDRLNRGGVFAPLADDFLKEVPITLEQIRNAVGEDDAVAVARLAHSLRGACLNVGAEPMAAVSQELEALGESGSTEDGLVLTSHLDELYARVKAVLETRLEQDHSDDVVSV